MSDDYFEATGTMAECIHATRRWGKLEVGDTVTWTLVGEGPGMLGNIYTCVIRKEAK